MSVLFIITSQANIHSHKHRRSGIIEQGSLFICHLSSFVSNATMNFIIMNYLAFFSLHFPDLLLHKLMWTNEAKRQAIWHFEFPKFEGNKYLHKFNNGNCYLMFIWASSPHSVLFRLTKIWKCFWRRRRGIFPFPVRTFRWVLLIIILFLLPQCLLFPFILYRFNVTKFLTRSELNTEQVNSVLFTTISNCFYFIFLLLLLFHPMNKNFVHWIHFRIAMNRFSSLNRALSRKYLNINFSKSNFQNRFNEQVFPHFPFHLMLTVHWSSFSLFVSSISVFRIHHIFNLNSICERGKLNCFCFSFIRYFFLPLPCIIQWKNERSYLHWNQFIWKVHVIENYS